MPFNATAWKQAKDQTSSAGEAPPDGSYDAELYATKLVTDKHDRRWLILTWVVLSGAHRDKTWESWHTVDQFTKDGDSNQAALSITVKQLAGLAGVELGDLPELASEADLVRAILEPATNQSFEVKVQRSGVFTNTYVQRKLVAAAPSLPGTGAPYGSPPATTGRMQAPSNAIYAGDVIASQSSTAEQRGTMPERTGESDVTTREDVQAFDRSTAPKQGDVDPETGEPIPF